MSDTSAFGFGQFVPGFDFLQNLAKTAGGSQTTSAAIPGMSSWIAPTLSVEELDKRIQELKAVQFWLEQNGTALKATIQALEVQKMTLTTLQGMNVNMAELARAFTAKMPESANPMPEPENRPAPEPEPQPEAAAKPSRPQAARKSGRSPRAESSGGSGAGAGPSVDPMRWWGSLTQQFQNIAAAAMQDAAAQAMQSTTPAPPAGPSASRRGVPKPPATGRKTASAKTASAKARNAHR